MPLGRDYDGQACSLARSLEVVGERWTLLILRDLFFGVRRFGELQAHLDVPRAVLSARLSALVERGLSSGGRTAAGATRSCSRRAARSCGRSSISSWAGAIATSRPTGRAGSSPTSPAAPTSTRQGACPACGVTPPPREVEMRPAPGIEARRDDPVTRALGAPHRLPRPAARQPRSSGCVRQVGPPSPLSDRSEPS